MSAFPSSTIRALSLAGVALLLAFGIRAFGSELSFDAMKKLVRTRFPEVPQLSTDELARWLRDPARQKPVLLDVRSEAEFAISHLPGAIRVDPEATGAAVVRTLPAGRTVVAYCSVGYRSSELARRLLRQGAKPVYNLEGSIFQWANEGRALEAAGQPAAKVHPYNATFGHLLDPARRADPGGRGRSAVQSRKTIDLLP